jgi:hypothetical protein
MKNKLEPIDIKWKMESHMSLRTYHHGLYRNDEYGIQREQITKVTGNGMNFGKGKNYFFIDGGKREFTDLQELCDCWNEMKSFDDPNNEIIYERVVVPKLGELSKEQRHQKKIDDALKFLKEEGII